MEFTLREVGNGWIISVFVNNKIEKLIAHTVDEALAIISRHADGRPVLLSVKKEE